MLSDNARMEKSTVTLEKLFAPVVHRWVCRRRLELSAKAAAEWVVVRPDVSVLQTDPILSSWSPASLQRLRDGATLIHRDAGMTLALAQEPKCATGVFWLLAGKVTQVPTKAETRECAMETPSLKDKPGALTGPVVFPTLFSRARGVGIQGASAAQRAAMVPAVEAVLDSLLTFSTGSLVDGAALMLGSLRQRALRCEAVSTLLFIPYSLLAQELQNLRGTPLRTACGAAKACLAGGIARRGDRPALRAILSRNPLLGSLEATVLKRVHAQLEPFVFGAGETIVADVFTADTVYFLRRGHVLVSSARGTDMVCRHAGESMGLHSFVPVEWPLYFEERRSATARTYCELWGITLRLLLRICEERDRLACAVQASKALRVESCAVGVAAALRAAPCFSVATDDTMVSVVKALRVHVGLPGDCLLTNRRPAKGGLLVISGQCVLVDDREGGARVALKCGTPMFFCESFAGVKPPQSVYVESSCLALYGAPSAILSQLDRDGCPYEEVRLIIEGSTGYVEHVYGRAQLACSQAQERAIRRVKAHDQLQKRGLEKLVSTPGQTAGDATSVKLVLENQVMTSLSLQLQSLHGDPLAIARFEHLHGLDTDVAWRPTDDEVAGRGFSGDGNSNSCVIPTGSAHATKEKEGFTLDEDGALVYTTSYHPSETHRNSSAWPQRRHGYDVRALEPPTSPHKATAHTAGSSATRVDAHIGTTSTPAPPLPEAVRNLTRQRGVLRTRDLHVPFQSARPASYTQERRRTPPPRLEALRREAAALTDEAYGINPEGEQTRRARRRL